MNTGTVQPKIRQSMTLGDWILLASLATLWGGSFFFIAVANRELPPFTIVALRVSIAALTLLLMLRLSGDRLPRARAAWMASLAMGFFNSAIPFSLIVWAETVIPSGLASVLNATTPFFTAIIVHFATQDEKLTRLKLVGVAIGIAGVAVLIGPHQWLHLGEHGLGEVAVVVAALSYGISGAIGRNFRRLGIAPMAAASGQMIGASVIMIPLSLLLDHPWTLPMPGIATIGSVLGLALLSTAVGYLIYFRLMGHAGATNVSLVTLLVPVSAILLGTLILGERLEPRHFAGMALIAAGFFVIDGRLFRRFRRG